MSTCFCLASPPPPLRQLALDLGVHHNTVALAYRELAAEGWLELRRGRGALVVERRDRRPSPGAREEFSRRPTGLVAKAASDSLARGPSPGNSKL